MTVIISTATLPEPGRFLGLRDFLGAPDLRLVIFFSSSFKLVVEIIILFIWVLII